MVLPEGVKNYTKTRPIVFEDFALLLEWWEKREENECAWRVPAADLLRYNELGVLLSVNLDVRNPLPAMDLEHLPPAELAQSIAVKGRTIAELMDEIKRLLAGGT